MESGPHTTRAAPDIPGERAPRHVAIHLQQEVARLLGRDTLSFPGAQPVSFARRHIQDELLKEDYYVCEKSDGIRCLMFLTHENSSDERVFLVTRRNEYFWIPFLHFPTNEGPSTFHTSGLIDGELLSNNRGELIFLIFDCLALEGTSLASRTLDKRLGYLRSNLFMPYQKLCAMYPQDAKKFPFQVSFKEMQLSYALPRVFNEIIPKLRHVSDGIIFTCRASPYVFGTDEKILKWKPPQENSVDFRLSLHFSSYTDPSLPAESATYTCYDEKPQCTLQVWLGRGLNYQDYASLYITDEEWESWKNLGEPLDERIVECFQDEDAQWRFLRFRDDKSDGNHVSVVEKVMESIRDGVSREELLERCGEIRACWKAREQELASSRRSETSECESKRHNVETR